MRAALLLVLAACGGPTVSATTTTITTSPTEAPPADIADHQHVAKHADDPSKLYVEVSVDGDQDKVLQQSATGALANVRDVVAVDDGGDVELHAEVASLSPVPHGTSCKVKIFVLRLPQHDLLAIADGGAQVTGSGAVDACVSATGTAIVQQKLPLVLARQLAAKK